MTSFSPRCLSSWTLSNKLFAEAWFGSLSFALGLGWTTRWEVLPESQACVPGLACVRIPPLDPTHNVSARLLGTWAFTERFGTTLELNFSHVPGTSSLNDSFAVYRSNSAMGGSLSIWFRTDGVLQRNWLDR